MTMRIPYQKRLELGSSRLRCHERTLPRVSYVSILIAASSEAYLRAACELRMMPESASFCLAIPEWGMLV